MKVRKFVFYSNLQQKSKIFHFNTISIFYFRYSTFNSTVIFEEFENQFSKFFDGLYKEFEYIKEADSKQIIKKL